LDIGLKRGRADLDPPGTAIPDDNMAAMTDAPPPAPHTLVTFCNTVASPESSVVLVDMETGHLREVGFDYVVEDFGATGLAWLEDGTLAMALAGSRRILRMSPALDIVGQVYDAAMADLHSITWQGDTLYAAATGRDMVLALRILTEAFEPAAAHMFSDSDGDTMHVNSVCSHQGQILVSAFGRNWRDHPVGSPIGEIVALDDRRVVSSSLAHPHSLVSHGGQLYVLGSFSGTVERVEPGGDRVVCATYPGYLRGLAFFEGGALVGISAPRSRSRGLGTINAVGDSFDPCCAILWFGPDWELVKRVDLSWYGREIFDIALVAGAGTPTVEDTLGAAKHRSVQLDASWEAPLGGPVPPSQGGRPSGEPQRLLTAPTADATRATPAALATTTSP
jgi:hypothetical protein